MSDRNLALTVLIKAKDLASNIISKFKGEIEKSSEQAEHLNDNLGKANTSLNDNATASQHAGMKASYYADKLSEADKAAGRFYDKQGRLREATGRYVADAARATEKTSLLKNALHKLTGQSADTERSLAGLTRQVVAFGATYLSINAVKNSIVGLLSVGARFEQMKVQISSLMGSIEAGNQAVNWIKDFASKAPADIEGVTQGFIRLKAFGIDPMNGSYQAIIDQTSKLGFSQEKMEGIILAVGQAWTKQKLQGEEVMQLVEKGVPVWDLLSKATGRNVVELQKMASAGELGRKEIALFVQEMGKSAEGAAQAQMSTWTGLTSNLKDLWLKFVNDINEAGFLDYAKAQLKELLDQVGEMAKDGRLIQYAQSIAASLVQIGTSVKTFLTTFVSDFDSMIRSTGAVLGVFKIAINVFAAGVKTVGLVISGFFSLVIEGVANTLDVIPGFSQIAERLRREAGAMEAVSTAFKNAILEDAKDIDDGFKLITGEAFDTAKSKLKSFQDQSRETSETVKTVAEEVQNAWSETKDAEVKATEQAIASKKEESKAWQALGLDIDAVTGKVTEHGQAVVTALETLLKSGKYTSEQLSAAFNKALDNVSTKADIEAVIDVMKKARKEGDLTGKSFNSAFGKATDKVKSLKTGTQDVTDETKDLNKELEKTGKQGSEAVSDIVIEIKKLIEEVSKLTTGFKTAGEEAQKMAKEAAKTESNKNNNSTDNNSTTRKVRGAPVGANQYYELVKNGEYDAAEIFKQLVDAYIQKSQGQVLVGSKAVAAANKEVEGLLEAARKQAKSQQQAEPLKASALTDRGNQSGEQKTVRVEIISGNRTATGEYGQGDAENLLSILADAAAISR